MTSSKTAFFLSHGGGPLPLLGDPQHADMMALLKQIAFKIQRPSAIIVVSAHWEEEITGITSGSNPSLIYDYYNFPPESYDIKYPCPGNASLAEAMFLSIRDSGIACELNPTRGFDHGLFVPLKIMYPEADIPSVQLSLLSSLDPGEHIRLGQALKNIAQDNLLVIGSGFSFHNMRAFFQDDDDSSRKKNAAFEQWLNETCSDPSISEPLRTERLLTWEQEAPHARYCHPREEHLLPLHVCYGYTESPCSASYSLRILNKQASMYLWESSK